VSELGVVAAGVVLAALLVARVHTPLGDAVQLLGSTAAFSLGVAVAGRWYLARRGEVSLRTQVLAVASSAVATVVVGTLVAARLMFISVHDLNALLAVMSVAVAVAGAASLELARRFAADTSSVAKAAESLVDRAERATPRAGFGIAELRELGRRVDDVSAQLASSLERERAL
jgi:hypothetical protein